MKLFGWFVGFLICLVLAVYVVLFTSVGNSLLKPSIEERIALQTGLNAEFEIFHISMSDIDILLHLDKDNSLHVKGAYSPFSQSFDLVYDVKMNKLQNLKKLTNAPLRGAFLTDGSIKGDTKFMKIDGKSDVAKSSTTYHVELTEFNPTSIIAKIKDAKLDALLYLVGQSAMAKADLDLDVNFKNITPHKLDGDITLRTKNGKIDEKLMKKDFGVNLPKTSFKMDLDAKLKGDDVVYKYALKSNLANITSSGKVIPDPLKTDIAYTLNIAQLAVLKPITGADVRGSFRLDGHVKGTKKKMLIDGKSDLASSNTTFLVTLKDFTPLSIQADIKALKIQKLLYMVKQPHYSDGLFFANIKIDDARSGKLKGRVTTNIKDGLLDSVYMTKTYEFKSPMPRTTYTLSTLTKLNGNIADTKVNLNSTLAKLDIKKARFNIKDSSLNSDYKVFLPSLGKLFFATGQKMRGKITANGEIKKAKDLDFTAHSIVANGKLDVKLHNDDLHVDMNKVQTLPLLHMMYYPEIFKSHMDAKVDYNLAKQSGVAKAQLVDGKFTQNQIFALIKQYAKIDMCIERFNGDVDAKLGKDDIKASLSLSSNTSSIKSKNAYINTKKQTIKAKVDIVANHNPITLKLKGSIKSPKVEVDASKLIQKEATKAVQKEVGKLLKGLF
jgi:hypothetical protein